MLSFAFVSDVVALLQQNDELIESLGHSNYKQKIKIMNKLKDDLCQVRNENLKITSLYNKMRKNVEKCEPAMRNMILDRNKENVDPAEYHV